MFQITVTHTPCLEQIAYCLAMASCTPATTREGAIEFMRRYLETNGELPMPPWIRDGRYVPRTGYIIGYEQAFVWARLLFPDAKDYQGPIKADLEQEGRG